MKIIKTHDINEPDISFIIPVYNEEKYLPYTLDSIKKQKTDLLAEIILIDDNSTDDTIEIANKYNCTIINNYEKLTVTQMRNLGYDASHGKTIMHLDGDTAMSPNYINKMVTPIIKNNAEATLCFWHEPLEVKYPVLPEKYSKSYAWFLHNLPHFVWGKIPIRFFLWIKNWIKKMVMEKKYISPLNIPDRVNGSAIIVKRSIPEIFGGWKKAFGAHADTDYTNNIFLLAKSIRWITGVTLYYSCRRYFPVSEIWLLKNILKPFIKNKIEKQHIDQNKGYRTPEGNR